MKRTISLVLLLLFAFSLQTVAHAAKSDPVKPMTLDEEKSLILRKRTEAKAVWNWTAAENKYKASIFAAILEQDRINDAIQEREEASRSRPRSTRAPEASSGRCGGNLPPCYVMERESGGDLRAENPVSTASGKWQFIDGTWNGYGGYSHASQAPEDVQDAKAAELWAGGAGCSHWSAC